MNVTYQTEGEVWYSVLYCYFSQMIFFFMQNE